MGVEPTADASEAPATGVEDRETHRDLTTPTGDDTRDGADGQTRKVKVEAEVEIAATTAFFRFMVEWTLCHPSYAFIVQRIARPSCRSPRTPAFSARRLRLSCSDRRMMQDVFVAYYIDHEPEHLWVADVDGTVVGYISGSTGGAAATWGRGLTAAAAAGAVRDVSL